MLLCLTAVCLSPVVVGREFVNTFVQFKKPIVVAVNGPAVGLGAALLPLCDVVWANEKAWFQTPYTVYGQTPDACASFTFPRIMGVASVRLPRGGVGGGAAALCVVHRPTDRPAGRLLAWSLC